MEKPSLYENPPLALEKPEEHLAEQALVADQVAKILEIGTNKHNFTVLKIEMNMFLAGDDMSSEYMSKVVGESRSGAKTALDEANALDAESIAVQAKSVPASRQLRDRATAKRQVALDLDTEARQTEPRIPAVAAAEGRMRTATLHLALDVLADMKTAKLLEGDDAKPITPEADGSYKFSAKQQLVYCELQKMLYGSVYDYRMTNM